MALNLDAQDHLELAGGNQQSRSRDEARDHRMTQKTRQETQAQQTHDQEHGTRQEGQGDRHRPVMGRARLGMLADGCSRHQRDHRHRTDRQHPAGAKNRIQQQRRNARIQPNMGRQPRQRGISQTLRDEHERDDQGGQPIAGQGAALVVAAPVKDGEKSPQAAAFLSHGMPALSAGPGPGPIATRRSSAHRCGSRPAPARATRAAGAPAQRRRPL